MTTGNHDDQPIRVVFLGNDPWSVPSLIALAAGEGIDLVLVITNPPRPAGRGGGLRSTAVADAARDLAVPLDEVASLNDEVGVERLRAVTPDVFVVVAYGELLRPVVLGIPRLGAVNVHLSLLPRWRGASPVQHAILAGDPVTGVTLMRMDEGLDTGPILARAELPIDVDEDAGSLGDRLAALGASMVPATITELAKGRISPIRQSGASTMAPKLDPRARRLDWARPAVEIVRRVRAFAPDPGASTAWRGESMKVKRAQATDATGSPPGSILAVDGEVVVVAAGSGAVQLMEIVPAGRRQMSAGAWARGARARPGETFA